MGKVWINFYAGQGRQVQLPKELTNRSVVGDTLDLMRGHTREITDEEWAHIQAEHPDLLSGIEVISKTPDPKPEPAKSVKPAAKPKADTKPEPAAEPEAPSRTQ